MGLPERLQPEDLASRPAPGPWEEAAPKIREQAIPYPARMREGQLDTMAEGDPADPEWVQRNLAGDRELTTVQLEMVREFGAPYQDAVRQCIRERHAAIEAARERKWLSGDYVRTVVSSRLVPQRVADRDKGRAFVSSNGGSADGWIVTISVYKSDVPELDEIDMRRHQAIHARNEALKDYIKSL